MKIAIIVRLTADHVSFAGMEIVMQGRHVQIVLRIVRQRPVTVTRAVMSATENATAIQQIAVVLNAVGLILTVMFRRLFRKMLEIVLAIVLWVRVLMDGVMEQRLV